MDGGLERLVRILHEFCICPPPPENPAMLYGLTPPSSRVQKPAPALNPPSFDKHAAYRFSLAFQCIVNIGVRGSEPIRSRVVQAGTLDVVGCILEAWLANKGFAVGPSATATGVPRETREQRQQRRLAQLEQKQREDAAHLQRALARQLQVEQQAHRAAVRDSHRRNGDDQVSIEFTRVADLADALQDDSMDYIASHGLLLLSESHPSATGSTSNNNSDTDVSADTSIAVTPQGSGTPTGSVVIPARDRSGTVIGRPVWDQPQTQPVNRVHHANHINSNHNINHNANSTPMTINTTLTPTSTTSRGRRIRHRELPPESPSPSPSDASRADTETEDDGEAEGDAANTTDNDVDMSQISVSASASPSPDRRPRHAHLHQHTGRRTVGIVADESDDASAQTLQLGGMGLDMGLGIGGLGGIGLGGIGLGGMVGEMGMGGDDAHIIVGRGEGMEAGIVALDANDDFAMGAPPGAPGALGPGPGIADLDDQGHGRGEQTPRNAAGRRNAMESAIMAPDVTPRAAVVGLPSMGSSTSGSGLGAPQRTATMRGRPAAERDGAGSSSAEASTLTAASGSSGNASANRAGPSGTAASASPSVSTTRAPFPPFGTATGAAPAAIPIPAAPTTSTASSTTHHAHREPESGPYRDEDVLLSLQLLAYLSKYPHVRQAFYKPRVTFHPASVGVGGARFGVGSGSANGKAKEKERERSEKEKEKEKPSTRDGFFKSFGASRASGSKASTSSNSTVTVASVVQPSPSGSGGGGNGAPSSARQTNVFSLVERFTFKPSSSEGEGGSGGGVPPRLPPEIQYWAGVIMRNACRKDDSRGGIRQCANSEYTFILFCDFFSTADVITFLLCIFPVMCGKWETYPREFAKCRRCRKAKYCGKECQSTAWSEGHRFWCSAKDVDEDGVTGANGSAGKGNASADTSITSAAAAAADLTIEGPGTGRLQPTPGATAPNPRAERQRLRHGVQHGPEGDIHPLNVPAPNGTVRAYRPPATDATGPSYASSTAVAMAPGTTVRAESGMSRDRTVVGAPLSPHHTHGHRTRLRPVIGTPAASAASTAQNQDPTNANYLTFHIQGSSSSNAQDTISRRRAETITGAMASATARMANGAADVAPNVVLPAQRPAMPTSTAPTMSDWAMNISGGVSPNANAGGIAISAGPSRRHRLANLQQRRSPPPPPDDRDDMVLG